MSSVVGVIPIRKAVMLNFRGTPTIDDHTREVVAELVAREVAKDFKRSLPRRKRVPRAFPDRMARRTGFSEIIFRGGFLQ
jgi:hypothetical protein